VIQLPTAKLTEKGNDNAFVEFTFPPEKLKIGHTSETKAVNKALGVPSADTRTATVVMSGDTVLTDSGDTILTFSEIILDGPPTLKYARQMLRWTYPVVKGPTGTDMAIPELKFTWGSFDLGPPYRPLWIVLTKVDVEYTRFTAKALPTRATITLNCKVKVNKVAGQNPTSGGEPERGGHRVTGGENIQGIARERYGDPRRWRQIAELNGVDDPLRVRPGDVLYLPGPAELERPPR
jgi:hypothetical protein